MLKIFFRLLGYILYWVAKKIDLRFLLPRKFLVIFDKLRIASLRLQGAKVGRNSNVRNDVFIAYPQNFKLDDNVTIGSYSRIFNYSLFVVGNNTEIGPGLHVQTNDHVWSKIDQPLGKQGSISNSVHIGKGVFIGANVTILKGVDIADNCVIAAGSVVIKNTESGYLYGGVPSKKICTLEKLAQ